MTQVPSLRDALGDLAERRYGRRRRAQRWSGVLIVPASAAVAAALWLGSPSSAPEISASAGGTRDGTTHHANRWVEAVRRLRGAARHAHELDPPRTLLRGRAAARHVRLHLRPLDREDVLESSGRTEAFGVLVFAVHETGRSRRGRRHTRAARMVPPTRPRHGPFAWPTATSASRSAAPPTWRATWPCAFGVPERSA